jgi:polyisoprenoid-binding protein YceI
MKRILLLLLACVPLAAEETVLDLDPSRTAVTFTLGDVLHTVRGSFKLKRGSVHFDSDTGKADGQIVVDVTSGNTNGNARDRRMHKDILESARYPDAIFIPDHVSGQISQVGESGISVHGAFQLHGATHEMTLDFHVRNKGGELSAATDFIIPYVQWGLKNPSTFLLKVSDKVQMHIEASGYMQQSTAAQ